MYSGEFETTDVDAMIEDQLGVMPQHVQSYCCSTWQPSRAVGELRWIASRRCQRRAVLAVQCRSGLCRLVGPIISDATANDLRDGSNQRMVVALIEAISGGSLVVTLASPVF